MQEVFKAIPAAHTINTVDFTAQKLYTNQMTDKHDQWPSIVLNYSQMGIPSEIRDVTAGVIYHHAMLTIHVLAKNNDGPPYNPGPVIARTIGENIITTISGWTTPITGGVRIFDPAEDIKTLQDLGEMPEFAGVYDWTLWVNLSY